MAESLVRADQGYAKMTAFVSGEARGLRHSDLGRQLVEMGQDLLRKLMQANLDMRRPGKRRNRCGMLKARDSRLWHGDGHPQRL